MKNYIMIFTMLLLSTACSSMQTIPDSVLHAPAPKALASYKAPDWVLKGGGAFTDSKGKAFYGVGSATGIKNYSLQRTVADDRARGDLAKVFQVYMTTLTKDYQAHTTAGSFENTSEEQNAEVALKVIVSQTMHGVVIVDHFEIPERREFLSLARLDYDAFQGNVESNEKFQELPEKLQEEIRTRADKLHNEMEEETLKLSEGNSFFNN
tara:strand:+ start:400 stop:1026 length:627 start_codon:yes stop_codon:yes gene_type:complete